MNLSQGTTKNKSKNSARSVNPELTPIIASALTMSPSEITSEILKDIAKESQKDHHAYQYLLVRKPELDLASKLITNPEALYFLCESIGGCTSRADRFGFTFQLLSREGKEKAVGRLARNLLANVSKTLLVPYSSNRRTKKISGFLKTQTILQAFDDGRETEQPYFGQRLREEFLLLKPVLPTTVFYSNRLFDTPAEAIEFIDSSHDLPTIIIMNDSGIINIGLLLNQENFIRIPLRATLSFTKTLQKLNRKLDLNQINEVFSDEEFRKFVELLLSTESEHLLSLEEANNTSALNLLNSKQKQEHTASFLNVLDTAGYGSNFFYEWCLRHALTSLGKPQNFNEDTKRAAFNRLNKLLLIGTSVDDINITSKQVKFVFGARDSLSLPKSQQESFPEEKLKTLLNTQIECVVEFLLTTSNPKAWSFFLGNKSSDILGYQSYKERKILIAILCEQILSRTDSLDINIAVQAKTFLYNQLNVLRDSLQTEGINPLEDKEFNDFRNVYNQLEQRLSISRSSESIKRSSSMYFPIDEKADASFSQLSVSESDQASMRLTIQNQLNLVRGNNTEILKTLEEFAAGANALKEFGFNVWINCDEDSTLERKVAIWRKLFGYASQLESVDVITLEVIAASLEATILPFQRYLWDLVKEYYKNDNPKQEALVKQFYEDSIVLKENTIDQVISLLIEWDLEISQDIIHDLFTAKKREVQVLSSQNSTTSIHSLESNASDMIEEDPLLSSIHSNQTHSNRTSPAQGFLNQLSPNDSLLLQAFLKRKLSSNELTVDTLSLLKNFPAGLEDAIKVLLAVVNDKNIGNRAQNISCLIELLEKSDLSSVEVGIIFEQAKIVFKDNTLLKEFLKKVFLLDANNRFEVMKKLPMGFEEAVKILLTEVMAINHSDIHQRTQNISRLIKALEKSRLSSGDIEIIFNQVKLALPLPADSILPYSNHTNFNNIFPIIRLLIVSMLNDHAAQSAPEDFFFSILVQNINVEDQSSKINLLNDIKLVISDPRSTAFKNRLFDYLFNNLGHPGCLDVAVPLLTTFLKSGLVGKTPADIERVTVAPLSNLKDLNEQLFRQLYTSISSLIQSDKERAKLLFKSAFLDSVTSGEKNTKLLWILNRQSASFQYEVLISLFNEENLDPVLVSQLLDEIQDKFSETQKIELLKNFIINHKPSDNYVDYDTKSVIKALEQLSQNSLEILARDLGHAETPPATEGVTPQTPPKITLWEKVRKDVVTQKVKANDIKWLSLLSAEEKEAVFVEWKSQPTTFEQIINNQNIDKSLRARILFRVLNFIKSEADQKRTAGRNDLLSIKYINSLFSCTNFVFELMQDPSEVSEFEEIIRKPAPSSPSRNKGKVEKPVNENPAGREVIKHLFSKAVVDGIAKAEHTQTTTGFSKRYVKRFDFWISLYDSKTFKDINMSVLEDAFNNLTPEEKTELFVEVSTRIADFKALQDETFQSKKEELAKLTSSDFNLRKEEFENLRDTAAEYRQKILLIYLKEVNKSALDTFSFETICELIAHFYLDSHSEQNDIERVLPIIQLLMEAEISEERGTQIFLYLLKKLKCKEKVLFAQKSFEQIKKIEDENEREKVENIFFPILISVKNANGVDEANARQSYFISLINSDAENLKKKLAQYLKIGENTPEGQGKGGEFVAELYRKSSSSNIVSFIGTYGSNEDKISFLKIVLKKLLPAEALDSEIIKLLRSEKEHLREISEELDDTQKFSLYLLCAKEKILQEVSNESERVGFLKVLLKKLLPAEALDSDIIELLRGAQDHLSQIFVDLDDNQKVSLIYICKKKSMLDKLSEKEFASVLDSIKNQEEKTNLCKALLLSSYFSKAHVMVLMKGLEVTDPTGQKDLKNQIAIFDQLTGRGTFPDEIKEKLRYIVYVLLGNEKTRDKLREPSSLGASTKTRLERWIEIEKTKAVSPEEPRTEESEKTLAKIGAEKVLYNISEDVDLIRLVSENRIEFAGIKDLTSGVESLLSEVWHHLIENLNVWYASNSASEEDWEADKISISLENLPTESQIHLLQLLDGKLAEQNNLVTKRKEALSKGEAALRLTEELDEKAYKFVRQPDSRNQTYISFYNAAMRSKESKSLHLYKISNTQITAIKINGDDVFETTFELTDENDFNNNQLILDKVVEKEKEALKDEGLLLEESAMNRAELEKIVEESRKVFGDTTGSELYALSESIKPLYVKAFITVFNDKSIKFCLENLPKFSVLLMGNNTDECYSLIDDRIHMLLTELVDNDAVASTKQKEWLDWINLFSQLETKSKELTPFLNVSLVEGLKLLDNMSETLLLERLQNIPSSALNWLMHRIEDNLAQLESEEDGTSVLEKRFLVRNTLIFEYILRLCKNEIILEKDDSILESIANTGTESRKAIYKAIESYLSTGTAGVVPETVCTVMLHHFFADQKRDFYVFKALMQLPDELNKDTVNNWKKYIDSTLRILDFSKHQEGVIALFKELFKYYSEGKIIFDENGVISDALAETVYAIHTFTSTPIDILLEKCDTKTKNELLGRSLGSISSFRRIHSHNKESDTSVPTDPTGISEPKRNSWFGSELLAEIPSTARALSFGDTWHILKTDSENYPLAVVGRCLNTNRKELYKEEIIEFFVKLPKDENGSLEVYLWNRGSGNAYYQKIDAPQMYLGEETIKALQETAVSMRQAIKSSEDKFVAVQNTIGEVFADPCHARSVRANALLTGLTVDNAFNQDMQTTFLKYGAFDRINSVLAARIAENIAKNPSPKLADATQQDEVLRKFQEEFVWLKKSVADPEVISQLKTKEDFSNVVNALRERVVFAIAYAKKINQQNQHKFAEEKAKFEREKEERFKEFACSPVNHKGENKHPVYQSWQKVVVEVGKDAKTGAVIYGTYIVTAVKKDEEATLKKALSNIQTLAELDQLVSANRITKQVVEPSIKVVVEVGKNPRTKESIYETYTVSIVKKDEETTLRDELSKVKTLAKLKEFIDTNRIQEVKEKQPLPLFVHPEQSTGRFVELYEPVGEKGRSTFRISQVWIPKKSEGVSDPERKIAIEGLNNLLSSENLSTAETAINSAIVDYYIRYLQVSNRLQNAEWNVQRAQNFSIDDWMKLEINELRENIRALKRNPEVQSAAEYAENILSAYTGESDAYERKKNTVLSSSFKYLAKKIVGSEIDQYASVWSAYLPKREFDLGKVWNSERTGIVPHTELYVFKEGEPILVGRVTKSFKPESDGKCRHQIQWLEHTASYEYYALEQKRKLKLDEIDIVRNKILKRESEAAEQGALRVDLFEGDKLLTDILIELEIELQQIDELMATQKAGTGTIFAREELPYQHNQTLYTKDGRCLGVVDKKFFLEQDLLFDKTMWFDTLLNLSHKQLVSMGQSTSIVAILDIINHGLLTQFYNAVAEKKTNEEAKFLKQKILDTLLSELAVKPILSADDCKALIERYEPKDIIQIFGQYTASNDKKGKTRQKLLKGMMFSARVLPYFFSTTDRSMEFWKYLKDSQFTVETISDFLKTLETSNHPYKNKLAQFLIAIGLKNLPVQEGLIDKLFIEELPLAVIKDLSKEVRIALLLSPKNFSCLMKTEYFDALSKDFTKEDMKKAFTDFLKKGGIKQPNVEQGMVAFYRNMKRKGCETDFWNIFGNSFENEKKLRKTWIKQTMFSNLAFMQALSEDVDQWNKKPPYARYNAFTMNEIVALIRLYKVTASEDQARFLSDWLSKQLQNKAWRQNNREVCQEVVVAANDSVISKEEFKFIAEVVDMSGTSSPGENPPTAMIVAQEPLVVEAELWEESMTYDAKNLSQLDPTAGGVILSLVGDEAFKKTFQKKFPGMASNLEALHTQLLKRDLADYKVLFYENDKLVLDAVNMPINLSFLASIQHQKWGLKNIDYVLMLSAYRLAGKPVDTEERKKWRDTLSDYIWTINYLGQKKDETKTKEQLVLEQLEQLKKVKDTIVVLLDIKERGKVSDALITLLKKENFLLFMDLYNNSGNDENAQKIRKQIEFIIGSMFLADPEYFFQALSAFDRKKEWDFVIRDLKANAIFNQETETQVTQRVQKNAENRHVNTAAAAVGTVATATAVGMYTGHTLKFLFMGTVLAGAVAVANEGMGFLYDAGVTLFSWASNKVNAARLGISSQKLDIAKTIYQDRMFEEKSQKRKRSYGGTLERIRHYEKGEWILGGRLRAFAVRFGLWGSEPRSSYIGSYRVDIPDVKIIGINESLPGSSAQGEIILKRCGNNKYKCLYGDVVFDVTLNQKFLSADRKLSVSDLSQTERTDFLVMLESHIDPLRNKKILEEYKKEKETCYQQHSSKFDQQHKAVTTNRTLKEDLKAKDLDFSNLSEHLRLPVSSECATKTKEQMTTDAKALLRSMQAAIELANLSAGIGKVHVATNADYAVPSKWFAGCLARLYNRSGISWLRGDYLIEAKTLQNLRNKLTELAINNEKELFGNRNPKVVLAVEGMLNNKVESFISTAPGTTEQSKTLKSLDIIVSDTLKIFDDLLIKKLETALKTESADLDIVLGDVASYLSTLIKTGMRIILLQENNESSRENIKKIANRCEKIQNIIKHLKATNKTTLAEKIERMVYDVQYECSNVPQRLLLSRLEFLYDAISHDSTDLLVQEERKNIRKEIISCCNAILRDNPEDKVIREKLQKFSSCWKNTNVVPLPPKRTSSIEQSDIGFGLKTKAVIGEEYNSFVANAKAVFWRRGMSFSGAPKKCGAGVKEHHYNRRGISFSGEPETGYSYNSRNSSCDNGTH